MKISKFNLIALTTLSFANVCFADNKITLKSHILHLIDGVSFMIDEYAIYDMIYMGNKIKGMLFGIENENKHKVGKYQFNGKKYTLIELAKLEEEYSNLLKKVRIKRNMISTVTYLSSLTH